MNHPYHRSSNPNDKYFAKKTEPAYFAPASVTLHNIKAITINLLSSRPIVELFLRELLVAIPIA